ncbi:TPA: hypothetical protein ACGZ9U_003535 [Elizabethkingia anophelis]
MKRPKLRFDIKLSRKYTDINARDFPIDWNLYKENLKNRSIMMHDDLHIEIGKFKTFNMTFSEVVDLALRFALGKQEFRRIAAEIIEIKSDNNQLKK